MKTWKAFNTRNSRILKNWRITDESGELVATLADSTDEYSRARLIAAAPELLDALEQIFEHCAIIQKVWGDGAINITPLINNAHAAISKARGQ